jgi:hypothetical protein
MHPHLAEVFALLDQSRAGLRKAVSAAPSGIRGVRPAADRWSITEILEHLSIVEGHYTAMLEGAIGTARAAGLAAERDPRAALPGDLRTRIRDRSERRKAPDTMVPSGALDEAAAWTALEDARQTFRDTVSGADGLALGQVTAEHRRWGALTVYQWVELLATHEARHTEQVQEIAAHFRSAGV